jgi:hypothetical protein
MSNNLKIKTFTSDIRQFTFRAGHNDMEKLEKTSTEEPMVEWDFASILPEGEILDSANSSIAITDENSISMSTSMHTCLGAFDNTKLRGQLKSGTNAVNYLVKFNGVTDPSNYKYEGYLLLQIRDKSI